MSPCRKPVQKAITFVRNSLQRLEIHGCLQVGFRILVPSLLTLLELEGINFTFPSKASLLAAKDVKMGKFQPELLYRTMETTLLHSLQTLINKVDFDRLGHHKVFGSMMGSPASTVAYLMNCSS